MKLYFTLRSIPQFANLSKLEQRSKYLSYYKKLRGHWLVWLPMVILVTGVVVLLEFVDDFVGIGYALLIGIGYMFIGSIIHNGIVYSFIASYMKKEEERNNNAKS